MQAFYSSKTCLSIVKINTGLFEKPQRKRLVFIHVVCNNDISDNKTKKEYIVGGLVLARFSFIPKEVKFFDLFERSAANIVTAAKKLQDLMEDCSNVAEKAKEIKNIEHEGDTITHEIVAQLHQTFVTPFDREDIAELAQKMDDVTDFINDTADAMAIYKIDSSTPKARELAETIVHASREIERAVPFLRKRSQLKNVIQFCVEINRLENKADAQYRAALGDLFKDTKDTQDIVRIIKWREIYANMESATDKCEDVANILEGVALKHA